MSKLIFVKEQGLPEQRCAILPQNVKSYIRLGAKIAVESGIGASIFIEDQEYIDAGATVFSDEKSEMQLAFSDADAILSVAMLDETKLPLLNPDVTTISFFDPFKHNKRVNAYISHKVSSVSMEMIPRSSRCQKMDALSSQASLAGYVMALQAISALNKSLPMMMTPAGTLKPAKVFVIGAGVAGLQAIATFKRMGANVIAYDTRQEVSQQVESLGAKFLNIDLGETGSTEQGYAKALTAEQLAKQQSAQATCIADSDIVVTTAQLFGRTPPVLIKNDVLSQMKPGSVVVDMAAQDGGNVEASVANQTIMYGGIKIIGTGDWASQVGRDASQMYANNLQALIEDIWSEEDQCLKVDEQDEVLAQALITHKGQLINPIIKSQYTAKEDLPKQTLHEQSKEHA